MTNALLAECATTARTDAGHDAIAVVDLRSARERRGLSLERISIDTKIPRALLEALECGKLDHFPGGIYGRAYARAYAAAVGLSSDAVLAALADHLPAEESLEQIAQATPRSVESSKRLVHRTRARLAALAVLLAGSLGVTGAWALGPRVSGPLADLPWPQAKPTTEGDGLLEARAIMATERAVQIPAPPSRTTLESVLVGEPPLTSRERLPLAGTALVPTMAVAAPQQPSHAAPEPLVARTLVTPMVTALPGLAGSPLSDAGAESSNSGNGVTTTLRGLRKAVLRR